MSNRDVLVHKVTVEFEADPAEEYLGDDIRLLLVQNRRLTVTLSPGIVRPPTSPGRVTQVAFEYKAEDQEDYVTVVKAGDNNDVAGAMHIKVGPRQPSGSPQPPVEIPARDIRPGQTFAVVHHQQVRLSEHSQQLQVGWHHRSCTWYYPY